MNNDRQKILTDYISYLYTTSNMYVNMRCDGKCPRMSNYDKRNKLNSLGRAL